MPAESLKSEKSDPIPMAAWLRPTRMKSPPNEGEELKKNVNGMGRQSKPRISESKKVCICSPTSHAGSFRCQLHRAQRQTLCRCSLPTNSNSSSTANKSKLQGQGSQLILSRFSSQGLSEPAETTHS